MNPSHCGLKPGADWESEGCCECLDASSLNGFAPFSAGEVLQDLCTFLQISELESVAEFPAEMEAFRAVLLRVDDYNAARIKMSAEMADSSNLAKTLVIKAEDARILEDIKSMRRAYAELYNQNAGLLGEYNKRANNHEQLLAALKEVNQMIQKAV